MKISVNGVYREVATATTLAELLEQLENRSEGVAVAVNLKFVPRLHYQHHVLRDSDDVEIVAPIAGG
jgi:sulfur carrier protein